MVATFDRGLVHFSFVIVALTTPALHIYYHDMTRRDEVEAEIEGIIVLT